jgi:hypothetical protein
MNQHASPDEVEFGVFLIHQLSHAWGKSTPQTYQILSDSNILDGYIFPCYDTLHTLGAQYLVDDLTDLARTRGALK